MRYYSSRWDVWFENHKNLILISQISNLRYRSFFLYYLRLPRFWNWGPFWVVNGNACLYTALRVLMWVWQGSPAIKWYQSWNSSFWRFKFLIECMWAEVRSYFFFETDKLQHRDTMQVRGGARSKNILKMILWALFNSGLKNCL